MCNSEINVTFLPISIKHTIFFPVNHLCSWRWVLDIHFSKLLALVLPLFCIRWAAWPVNGRWRMKRRWRGRRGGRWGAPAAPPTPRMIPGYRPARWPSATARQRHAPFRRALRCSAGKAHSPYWGLLPCFCATKPKTLFVSSCVLVQTLQNWE